MDLRREIALPIVGLMFLNLLLSFGSIGLFVRMGPVIQQILRENMYSIVAAEEILAELAGAGGEPLSSSAQERIQEYIWRAQRNVTEEGELQVLELLERDMPVVLNGDSLARSVVTQNLRQLIQINRNAMQRADNEARRLSSAGAWAVVLLGFFSFLLSVFVIVRYQQKFVRPLIDLYAVLASVYRGDKWRRCSASDAPQEIVRIMGWVNEMCDERLRLSGEHFQTRFAGDRMDSPPPADCQGESHVMTNEQ